MYRYVVASLAVKIPVLSVGVILQCPVDDYDFVI